MSVTEMKQAILNKVWKIEDEKFLEEILALLEKKDQPQDKEIDLKKHVNDIIKERSEVLKKLAQ